MNTKLTVVYDADTIQDIKALLDAHPWSAMGHGHAIHERDAALREVERLQKRVAEMQAPHARGEVDSTTLRLASLLELSGALPESCTMRAATELRRLIAKNEALQAQLDAVGAGGVEPLRKRHLDESDSETLDKIMTLADMYASAAITDGCPVDRLPRNVLRRAIAGALNQRASDAPAQPPAQAQDGARKPLTDGYIFDWWSSENGLEDCNLSHYHDFAQAVRAVEAAHGIGTSNAG